MKNEGHFSHKAVLAMDESTADPANKTDDVTLSAQCDVPTIKGNLSSTGKKFIMCLVEHTMIVQLLSKCFVVLQKLKRLGLEHHLDKQKIGTF
jgi:hypothetical protein